jgi:uncharacterized membrane protein YbhN (UPF0104 family)
VTSDSPAERRKGRRRIGDRVEEALAHRADVEGEIRRGEAEQPTRRGVLRTIVWLGITAVSLYLVAPGLIDTLSSWRDVEKIAPIWLLAMAGLQAGAVVCTWAVQRIALHTSDWYAVATSQLAANGISKVVPGGGAVGAAMQYRMLVQSGLVGPRAVAGLTASNLLLLGVVLALPVLAIPAIARGAVDRSLVEASLIGVGVFAGLFVIGALMLALDGPLAWAGRLIQRVRNRLRRGTEPLRGLPARLLRERDRILTSVGPRWKAALAAGVGRWAFEFGTLLAALAALGSTPRPAVVLLAFCAAQLLAQIPFTPGGLGFVEAGLTATLALAGVAPGDAVLATFAYRLFTFWLPLPLGLIGVVLHRRRYAGASAAIV